MILQLLKAKKEEFKTKLSIDKESKLPSKSKSKNLKKRFRLYKM
jgi:hypothetical protein